MHIGDVVIGVEDTFQVRANDEESERSATGFVLDNDSNTTQDELTAELDTDVENGTLDLEEDGSFTYTPDALFVGADTFTYIPVLDTVSDPSVTVTIYVYDEAPVASDLEFSTRSGIELDADMGHCSPPRTRRVPRTLS